MGHDISEASILRGLGSAGISEIRASGRKRRVAKGEALFLEDAPGDEFFILLEGMIRLGKSSEDGREITVKIISPPENFAETILFESDRYPVSAIAVEDSEVFALSRGTFFRLLEKRAFRDEFISMLMKKQRYLAERIFYLTSCDVEERFFRYLLDNHGRRERYEIDISKKDIASAIGTIPETLSRLLSRLRARGIVDWKGNSLTLPPGFWEEAGLE